MPITLADAQAALDAKTKPPGSLGRLEALAARMAALQDTLAPQADPARAVVFAADHGVTVEGVSPYPSSVTAQMVRTFASGGAAVTVLARAAGCAVEAVDVGVDADLTGVAGGGARVVQASVRRGTHNLAARNAMTAAECAQAVQVGRDAAARAAQAGVRVLLLGEMGIGNTTASAALLSALTGADAVRTVGRGTGVDDAGLARKRAVVGRAVARFERAQPPGGAAERAYAALASLGGLEIAALVGAMREAAARRVAVVVDGFIVTVAALAAARVDPVVAPALVFAHVGSEAGHRLALEACSYAGCDARPLLDLDLRLGEASGAVAALPLVRAACALFEMATFEAAGVSGPQ